MSGSSSFNGDEFANNLFTDLGPLIALFGAQITTQFMSESHSWADSVLFAIAPLGVITAITSAIRVGGPRILRALIGRASEPRAQIEIELMSSTSYEVCHLWSGDSIVRVAGEPEMVELVLFPGDQEGKGVSTWEVHKKEDCQWIKVRGKDTPSQSTAYTSSDKISQEYDAEDPDKRTQVVRVMPCAAPVIKNSFPPNISLNYAPQLNDLELPLSALIAVILQIGVLAMDGLITFRWKLEKAGNPVPPTAFWLTLAGTVLLTIGMLLCSVIVEKSTRETWYELTGEAGKKGKVLWLQREGVVSDQQFESYAIFAAERKVVVDSERESHFNRQKQRNGGQRGLGTGEGDFTVRMFVTNTATVVATVVSLTGYVVQFIGFRKMHWLASIIQLGFSLLMTAWRSFVRRNLWAQPLNNKLTSGYEIDWLATRRRLHEGESGGAQLEHAKKTRQRRWLGLISDIKAGVKNGSFEEFVLLFGGTRREEPWYGEEEDRIEWFIVDGVISEEMTDTAGQDNQPANIAKSVLDIRERLGHLTGWRSPIKDVAASLILAIEAVIGIASHGLISVSDGTGRDGFKWGFGVGQGDDPLWLHVRRDDDSWKHKIEAVLSLWTYQLSLREGVDLQEPGAGFLWRLGPSSREAQRDYNWWVFRGSKPLVTDLKLIDQGTDSGRVRLVSTDTDIPRHRVFGFEASKLESHPETTQSRMVLVDSTHSIAEMCARHLFSIFMSFVAKEIVEIKGNTEIDVSGYSKGRLFDSVRLVNPALQRLAEKVENSGLFTLEEAYMAIVLPLSALRRLPRPSSLIEATIQMARSLEAHQEWLAAAELHIELLTTCKSFGSDDWMMVKATAISAEFFSILAEAERVYTSRAQDVMLEEIKKSRELVAGEIAGGDANVRRALATLYKYQYQPRQVENLTIINNPLGATRRKWDEKPKRYTEWTNIFDYIADGDEDLLRSLLANSSTTVNDRDMLDWTPLHYAVFGTTDYVESSRACLQLLLQDGADPNATNILGKTPLHYAVTKGDEPTVNLLVQYGGRMDATSGDGKTPLHFAAMEGNTEMVTLLYEKGADIETRDNFGQTPLHLAALGGKIDVVMLLLELRAEARARESSGLTPLHAIAGQHYATNDIEKAMARLQKEGVVITAKDHKGRTPLHWAARSGTVRAVEALLHQVEAKKRSDIDQSGMTPLHWAAKSGNFKVANILGSNDMESRDRSGKTPLHLAAECGRLKFVQILLGWRVEVGAKSHDGMTPLHMVKSAEVAKELLRHGADIHARDEKGRKPLHCATELDVVDVLLTAHEKSEHNTPMDMLDNQNMTPLHWAAQEGRTSVVERHLMAGAPIDAQDDIGMTPLQIAANKGHICVVESLLKHKASTESKDQEGMSALDRAIVSGHRDVVALLLKGNASIGTTTLHLAARLNALEIARLLLGYGAEINAEDDEMNSPLHVAVEHGNMDMANILVEAGADRDAVDKAGKTPMDLFRDTAIMEWYRKKWAGNDS